MRAFRKSAEFFGDLQRSRHESYPRTGKEFAVTVQPTGDVLGSRVAKEKSENKGLPEGMHGAGAKGRMLLLLACV